MSTLSDVVDFIRVAHAGQVDKGKRAPYWEHPLAVMNTLPPFASDELKAAALLHDVIEDTAFRRDGDWLVFDSNKFASLGDAMQQARRPAEIALARERDEPSPESTAPVLHSPRLTTHVLDIVEGVTNEEFEAPAGLSREDAAVLALAHYHDHLAALANDRPVAPDALRLAEDRVLLKFTDMAQNLNRDRLSAISDKSRLTWFAHKYAQPFEALRTRAREIALRYGYELVAETMLEDDGLGNSRFYLTHPQEWHQIPRPIPAVAISPGK